MLFCICETRKRKNFIATPIKVCPSIESEAMTAEDYLHERGNYAAARYQWEEQGQDRYSEGGAEFFKPVNGRKEPK